MAFKGKNLRSGDLAEHFALYVLNSYAFAISYPRQEDFGIDAIVTLQSELDKKRLTAEESFYIQIKASSVKKIKYKPSKIPWLKALKLPFFIGLSNPRKQTLELFCLHRLNDKLFDIDDTKEIILDLNASSSVESKSTNTIGVGPPICLIELGKTQPEIFYSVLKAHIILYNTNLFLRQSRFCYFVNWTTDIEPIKPDQLVINSHRNDITPEQIISNAKDIMEPFFYNWILEMRNHQDFESAINIKEMLLQTEKDINEINNAN